MGYQLQQYKVILEKIEKLEEKYNDHRAAAKAQKGFFRSVGSVGENKERAQTLEILKSFRAHIVDLVDAIQNDKHKNPSDKTFVKYSQLLHAIAAFFLAQIYMSYKIDLFEDKSVLPVDQRQEAGLSTVSNSGMARALCELLAIERFGDLSSAYTDYLKDLKTTLAKPVLTSIAKHIAPEDIDKVVAKIDEHYAPKPAADASASVVKTL